MVGATLRLRRPADRSLRGQRDARRRRADGPTPLATPTAAAGSLAVSVTNISAEAAASRLTEAFVGHHAVLDLGGPRSPRRPTRPWRSRWPRPTIKAGSGAGIANVSIFKSEARVGLVDASNANSQASATRAFVDNNAIDQRRVNVTLDADSITEAKADIFFRSASAASPTSAVGDTIGTAAHDTEAFVGDDVTLQLTGRLTLDAPGGTSATPWSPTQRLAGRVRLGHRRDHVIDSDTARLDRQRRRRSTATSVKVEGRKRPTRPRPTSIRWDSPASSPSATSTRREGHRLGLRAGSGRPAPASRGQPLDGDHDRLGAGIDVDADLTSTVTAIADSWRGFASVGGSTNAIADARRRRRGPRSALGRPEAQSGDVDVLASSSARQGGARPARIAAFARRGAANADADFNARRRAGGGLERRRGAAAAAREASTWPPGRTTTGPSS